MQEHQTATMPMETSAMERALLSSAHSICAAPGLTEDERAELLQKSLRQYTGALALLLKAQPRRRPEEDGREDEPEDDWTDEPEDGWTDEPEEDWADQPEDGWTDESEDDWTDEPEDGWTDEPEDEPEEPEPTQPEGGGAPDAAGESDEAGGAAGEITLDLAELDPADRALIERIVQRRARLQNPEVKKALTEAAGLRKALELRELEDSARPYRALGKDPAQLALTFYQLRKAGGGALEQVRQLLDEQLALAERGPLFKELGSSRAGGRAGSLNEAVAQVRLSEPALSYPQAVVKAYQLYPHLKEVF